MFLKLLVINIKDKARLLSDNKRRNRFNLVWSCFNIFCIRKKYWRAIRCMNRMLIILTWQFQHLDTFVFFCVHSLARNELLMRYAMREPLNFQLRSSGRHTFIWFFVLRYYFGRLENVKIDFELGSSSIWTHLFAFIY